MTKYKILSLLICLLFFLSSTAFAKEKTFLTEDELKSFGFISYEQINPNLLIYPLKRGYEQIKLTFIPNNLKKEYAYQLLEKRLKELTFIINFKKEGFIPYAADRYNTFVGKTKLNYPPDANDKLKIKNYLKMLERLRDIYPANSPNWEKIQQTVDTTKSLI